MAGEFPQWMKYMTEADAQAVEAAVVAAEKKSRIEIVPVIVRRSMVIGHVPVILALMGYVLALLVLLALRESLTDIQMLIGALSALVLMPVLAFPLSRLAAIQRWITVDADEVAQVYRRGFVEFTEQKMSATQARSGILIFVSLVEHKALLLPDVEAAKIFTRDLCQEWMTEFTDCLRKGQWKSGFIELIEKIGAKAAIAMPRGADDTDELGNHLQIKE